MSYRVVFSPEAEQQMIALHEYISANGNQIVANGFIADLLDYLEGFVIFPERGNRRDDIRPGMRVTNFRHRTVIAFAIDGDNILIAGIYHGGADYESM
ncbi:plasmid stabilization protein [Izhakiella australiensis]|uniref:Plasmid stabilization protein n=1 Tax=Izhakiella australiensis TaxID=1926881 RepID=A0A1S8YTM8_9GAMM|nr:type II toxin-antitoxin system RelE/ParE family toxin [Izhakiella australiensis]OON42186.1 plasmid stabilization protein [Izhakiella australiensis]